ncbi:MAG TPA: LysR family transcriptional regulator [Steroidobacteraceae bacterium]|nr:LysR family transcriptional regulator [Steroidobacteraceae bacterium]
MLDTRWLEDFLAIANTRSFKKAAETRNVSQSGLSRRVQSLEQWAGAALVDRNAGPLELTEAGRDLLPIATTVVSSLAQLRHRIADRVNQDKKLLRLTAPHILSATFFPDWLPRISQLGGSSEIVVVSQNLLNCFEALDRGDVHFVVCLSDQERTMFKRIPEPLRADPELIAKVGDDRLIPVSMTNKDGTPRFKVTEKGTPLLQYTPECSLGWSVEDILVGRPELQLRKLTTNPFADGLRLMVASGVGVAWLPESLVTRELNSGTMVRAGEAVYDVPLDVLVIRPVHRLTAHGERIWQSISDGGQVAGKVGPPQLHVVN